MTKGHLAHFDLTPLLLFSLDLTIVFIRKQKTFSKLQKEVEETYKQHLSSHSSARDTATAYFASQGAYRPVDQENSKIQPGRLID